jgi:hypothetical protein
MTTQQTNLTDLLAAHPRTVAAVDEWLGEHDPLKHPERDTRNRADCIRFYAASIGMPDACMASISDILATIEARLTAEATPPLSDEEIAKMRWSYNAVEAVVKGQNIPGGDFACFSPSSSGLATHAHNADIDRLASEIRRQRAKCGEVKP